MFRRSRSVQIFLETTPCVQSFLSHEEVLSLQSMVPLKRFDVFSPLTGGCSEGYVKIFLQTLSVHNFSLIMLLLFLTLKIIAGPVKFCR